jgi:hypothetical protein
LLLGQAFGFFVPEGHAKIAQHFSAGEHELNEKERPSPGGTSGPKDKKVVQSSLRDLRAFLKAGGVN